MKLLDTFGACDCHSHVFGPFAEFPLSPQRAFDPSESRIEELEKIWDSVGIGRAVLVQGSAHGDDHGGLLAAIARSPKTRRGVALLKSDVTDSILAELHRGGIRAVRFNWIHHLLAKDSRSEQQRLTDAAVLVERTASLGWHVEVHTDIADLDLVTRLSVPKGTPVVIDHMARIDVSASDSSVHLAQLLRVLDDESFWVKISGSDRLTLKSEDLRTALNPMRQILQAVTERCVWGLDWPHVNLGRKRSDEELVELLIEATGDQKSLKRVLVDNPAKLYGFALEDS
jgi:2-pyrone-4,6-dicarboxylate lactonase